MNLPVDTAEYAPWVLAFALNVGAGLVLVLAYNAVRSTLPANRPTITNIVIGVLFAVATLVSMHFPIRTASGFSVDARSVFILIGSLFGGPAAALIAGTTAIVFRFWLGGPGALAGSISVIVTALFGTLLQRRLGKRVTELRGHELFLIGLANSFLITAVVEATLALQGNPGIPVGASVGAYTVFPLGAMLLGSVMGMTHHRIWWRTQRRLDDIVETVSDLVWETDAKERISFLSERHNQILGIDPKTAIGKGFETFDTEWIDAETARADAEARAAHKPFSGLLLRFRMADGTIKILSVSGRPAFDERGRYVGYRGTAQDITRHVQMEDALRRSRDDLARAQKLGHIGSAVRDLVTGAVSWSDEQYRLLGLDPAAGGGGVELYLSRVHPADRARFREEIERNLRGEEPIDMEFRVVLPSGGTRWIRREAEFERDGTGRPIKLYSATIDITESRRLEEELRASRDMLARAQKIGRVGSGSVDLLTGETIWSDEQYRMLGLDPEKGGASLELYLGRVYPDDRALLLDTRTSNEAGQPTKPIEYRIVLPSGDTRWMRREVEVERDASGRPVMLYTTMIDVTESRRLEEELRRSRDGLIRAQKMGRIGSASVNVATGENIWSDEMYRMLGFDPAAKNASLDLYLSRVHPDDLALVLKEREREAAGAEAEAIEYRINLPGGETRWVRREAEIERDASNKPAAFYLTLQDITESRRLQEELRRNADHLERAQRAAHIGSAEVDLATGQEYWSDGMFRLCGIEPNPAKANYASFLEVVHPDDRAMMRGLRAKNHIGQQTEPIDYRQLRPNGEVRWIRREVEIGYDAAGAPARLVAIHRDVTESRRLEEELRRSADHLRKAQRTARIGSVEVDLATGHEYWSEGMYQVCNLEPNPANANFETYIAQVHPDDRPLLKNLRVKNNQGLATDPVDYRMVRPNGEIRWIRREVEIGFDASGTAVRRIAIHQDITERKLAEEELRRSRDANARGLRTLRMLSDCNELLIHATDESQLIKDICRTICEVGDYAMAWVGYAQHDEAKSVKSVAFWGKIGLADVEELVNTANISWDENSERGRGPMGRALRSGQIELEHDLASSPNYGPWRAGVLAHGIRSTLTIPLKSNDQVFGAIGIYATTLDAFDKAETELLAELGSDLNYGIHVLRTRAARDKAERELSDARDALRVIMDHAVDGLVTIDEHGTVLTFSRPAQAIFGYTADEVIGQNVKLLVSPPHAELHDSYIARYLATGKAKIIGIGREVMGRRKDGTIFPMDLQVGEIPGGPGGHRFVGTMRDISERKKTEEHLRQAQKMEAMGQLTGGVAHDFNNLLAVILGRLQLLDEELGENPHLQNWARSCIKAVERGATLTRSLLAFSRQQALEPVELDLNAVLGDMEDMIQRTLGEAFDFRVFKGDNLWHVEADPGQLQNALLNLVLNARDAMPKGGSLLVSTSNTVLDVDYAGSLRDVRPGDYVLLAVSDTGVGMPREVVERAFEPFYTTKEVGKGSGLGLSMVYGFVKQTGGHVSIYSEPGHGTTVRIFLPRKVNPGFAANAGLARANPAVAGTETILLVEDNDDLRDLTRLQLERFGYKVLEASHGAEGLRALANNPHVDLLISDVVLPHGMTGPDLADQATALWPDLKVIFVSGYNEEHDTFDRTRARRPVRLLQKPFRAEDLAAMIRAALD